MKVHFDHAKDFQDVAVLIESLKVGKPTATSYSEIGAAINALRFMAGAVRTVQRSISTKSSAIVAQSSHSRISGNG